MKRLLLIGFAACAFVSAEYTSGGMDKSGTRMNQGNDVRHFAPANDVVFICSACVRGSDVYQLCVSGPSRKWRQVSTIALVDSWNNLAACMAKEWSEPVAWP